MAVTVEDVAAAVSARFGCSYGDLLGPARPHALTRPRQAAMWLADKLTRLDYRGIGRELGGRDRTTVRHGVRATETAMLADPEFAAALDDLRESLAGSDKESPAATIGRAIDEIDLARIYLDDGAVSTARAKLLAAAALLDRAARTKQAMLEAL